MSDPWVSLPSGVVISTGYGYYDVFVPTTVTIAVDPSLGDHTLTAVQDSPTNPLVVGLIIGRSGFYQLTIYIVALLPLLLGWIVVHIWFRRGRQVFDLGFIAGLIAAMLAILPLRAVLIPADLNTGGLTVVDNILVLGVLFVASFLFAQYALSFTPRLNETATSETGRADRPIEPPESLP
jgi:hypothetical protein